MKLILLQVLYQYDYDFILHLHKMTLQINSMSNMANMTLPWIKRKELHMWQTVLPVSVVYTRKLILYPNAGIVYMILMQGFAQELKSQPSTVTEVNLQCLWYDSFWHDILCWCHVLMDTEPQERTRKNSYQYESTPPIND